MMNLNEIISVIPAAIIGLTVHEYAHAYTAYRCGDSTAKDQGRLTLNPLKHIDWLGFALIVIAGFGWAKPVQFNPDNLRRKHRDEILISIAGPLSNLALAIIFFILARSLYAVDFFNSTDTGFEIINMIIIWGVINISLFIFNLIPIPPLDGSHVYLTYLKEINQKLMMNMYRYGTFVLLGIIILENNDTINILHISEITGSIAGFMIGVLGF